MIRRHQTSTLTDTLCPYTTLFRSADCRDSTSYRRHHAICGGDNRKRQGMITRQVTPRSRSMRQKPTVLAREIVASSRLFRVEERTEAHTSELQSLMRNSYAGFGLKKTK